MSSGIYVDTIFGTRVPIESVQDPEDLIDPSDYWDKITAIRAEQSLLSNEDGEDEDSDEIDFL